MLTYNDRTVPDAVEVFHSLKDTGISHIGFKDIGLPLKECEKLVRAVKKERMEIYLEIVSATREETIISARQAVELGVDYVIGGRFLEQVAAIAKEAEIHYYPYVGRITGHPCLLRGSINGICAGARKCEDLGVDGVNLLAYRYDGDSNVLIRSMKGALKLPLIVAGSVDSVEKIRFLATLDIAAFTAGTAVFEKRFLPGRSLGDQVEYILREAEKRSQLGQQRALVC